MKRLTPIIFCLFFPLIWPSFSQSQGRGEIVIVFTHDLHSYFLPHQTDDARGMSQQGGYAKIASLIHEYRKKYGEKLLVVDAGDFSMGTLFHTVFRKEASELVLMAEMGYEVITLGNHEFDFHPDGLAEALKTAREKIPSPPIMVAANLSFGPPDPRDLKLRQMGQAYPIKKYVILRKGNYRIGIFGLLGRDAKDDAPFARPLKFLDPVETAKETVKALKNEGVDFIVCLSHSGTSPQKSRSEDEHLSRSVPEIDLIVSGHTHTVLLRPIIQGKTVIASAGRYGEHIGVVKFAEAQGSTRLEEYKLIPVTAHIPDEPRIAKLIAQYKLKIDKSVLSSYELTFDGVIGEINYRTESLNEAYARRGETGLGNLIADAFRHAIKEVEGENYEPVHLAIQPLGLIRSSFFQGKITVNDVFRVLSLGLGRDGRPGYPLLTTYLSGKEIKQLMEIETTVSRIKRDAHLQVSGVKMKYNPYRLPFDRVISVEVQSPEGHYQPLIPDRLYRVAMNYYSAQMVDYITRVSHGLIVMKPKDKSGNLMTRIEDGIVKMPASGSQGELKEWVALTLFLKSFPDINENGIPDVPPRYQRPEGRITSLPSWNPVDLMQGATYLTWIAGGLVLFLFLILGFLLWFIAKKLRRQRS